MWTLVLCPQAGQTLGAREGDLAGGGRREITLPIAGILSIASIDPTRPSGRWVPSANQRPYVPTNWVADTI
jgi:hypothetical protein